MQEMAIVYAQLLTRLILILHIWVALVARVPRVLLGLAAVQALLDILVRLELAVAELALGLLAVKG